MKYPIAIDIRKCRIRLHKTMLRKLGNPKYIQLLINPDKMIIAILCVEREMSGDQSFKINYNIASPDSIEMYSRSLVTQIYDLIKETDEDNTFRIYGEIIPSQNLAVFPLNKRMKIDIS